MSRVAKKLCGTSRLLVLTSKSFPSSNKMIQPASPVVGFWRSGYRQAGKPPFVPPTYNEMPVPYGSWDKWHKRVNEKYNRHLMFGIGFFLFTLFVASRVVTLNHKIPPLTEDIEDLCAPKGPPKCV